jgi:hypothetical protein
MDFGQLAVGLTGSLVGVIGWLLVGLYIQSRAKVRAARDAARAVYFELVANQLAIFMALEYGVFGTLSRSTYDRLLPEISTFLRIEELQSVTLAYLGHAGYDQAARDGEVPQEVRRMAMGGLNEAHLTAIRLVRERAFRRDELSRLAAHATPDQQRLLDAAEGSGPPDARQE